MPMKTFEIQNILSVYTLSQLSTGRAWGGGWNLEKQIETEFGPISSKKGGENLQPIYDVVNGYKNKRKNTAIKKVQAQIWIRRN